MPPDAVTPSRRFNGFSEITSFIWSVADLLRGDYKQADYGKVILPFTVLRRLDCVLDATREAVWKKHESLKGSAIKEPEEILNRASKVGFHNVSKFDFEKLKGDPNHLAHNLTAYIKGFSSNARDVIERFKFAEQIGKLDESNLLFQVSLTLDVPLGLEEAKRLKGRLSVLHVCRVGPDSVSSRTRRPESAQGQLGSRYHSPTLDSPEAIDTKFFGFPASTEEFWVTSGSTIVAKFSSDGKIEKAEGGIE